MRMKLIRTAACLAALGLAVCTAVDARPPGPPSGADRLRRVIITIIDGTISEETSLAEHWCSA